MGKLPMKIVLSKLDSEGLSKQLKKGIQNLNSLKGKANNRETGNQDILEFHECEFLYKPTIKSGCCSKPKRVLEGSLPLLIDLLIKYYNIKKIEFRNCIFNDGVSSTRDTSTAPLFYLGGMLKLTNIEEFFLYDSDCTIQKQSVISFALAVVDNTKLRRLAFEAGTHATTALCNTVYKMINIQFFRNPRLFNPKIKFHSNIAIQQQMRKTYNKTQRKLNPNNPELVEEDVKLGEEGASMQAATAAAAVSTYESRPAQTGMQGLHFAYPEGGNREQLRRSFSGPFSLSNSNEGSPLAEYGSIGNARRAAGFLEITPIEPVGLGVGPASDGSDVIRSVNSEMNAAGMASGINSVAASAQGSITASRDETIVTVVPGTVIGSKPSNSGARAVVRFT